MALSTTQVNAAYVALLGRAAEGGAANWAAGSLTEEALAQTILSIDDSYKNDVERKATNADFVNALYTELLGKTGDAEGKTFWINALNSGLSREQVKWQFINAAKANNENLSAFYADNELFVNTVYSNLLGRGADSDGLKFWADALNNGASKASVIANIITAIQAQPTSEDFKTFSAKMAVANTISEKFSGFKAGLNAEQKQAALDTMKQIIQSTTADVKPTDETIKTSIDNLVGNYEKETIHNFRVSEESYDLGDAESTNSQTFRGTINLIDDKKSTYTNKANVKASKYSDSLIIDVVSNQANKTLDASKIKSVSGIDSLTINNGTADVNGLKSDGFKESIKVTGAADVSGSVSSTLNYLEVSTGAGKKATITVSANLKEYKATGTGSDEITISGANTVAVNKIDTGAGNDTVNVSGSGSITGTLDMGNGNDTVVVSGASSSISGAKINLGAGDDKITLTAVQNTKLKGATIDGGAGRDTLIVSGDISGSGDFTLKNIEVLQASGGTAKVSYAQIKDQTLTLTSGGSLEILATNKETAIDLTKLNNKAASGETALTALTLDKVGSGATSGVTVTLNKNDGIAETIKLDQNAKGNKAVTITGIASGDMLELKAISGLTSVSSLTSLSSNNSVSNNKAYFVNATEAVTDATKALSALSGISVSSFSTTTAKALIAFNNGGKAYLFVASDTDSNTTIGSSDLTLVGIVDNVIDGSDTVAAGVITFA
nr:DUF4214 domain-containing protein [uncultured Campylobacter sp.]